MLESLFNKVESKDNKEGPTQGFFVNIAKFFKNTFFTEHLRWLLLLFLKITRKWTCGLPHELPNNLGLMILRNEELLRLFTCVFIDLMTRRFALVTRGFELVTRGFELVTCGSELVTRGFELVTRRFELVTCGFELVTRWFELVTCRFELVTRGFELALLNFNSCFQAFNSCF